MYRKTLLILLSGFSSGVLAAQVPGNSSLTGKYWFRELQVNADNANNVTQVTALAGSITFDGAGKFTYTGSGNVGPVFTTAISGSGTYTVKSNGFVTLTKPQDTPLTLNGRLAGSALLASATEGQSNEFDILIAIPAPTTSQSLASLIGAYQVGTLDFPSGVSAQVRSTTFALTADGVGNFQAVNINGHAANVGNGAATLQTVTGATYTLAAAGSGTANFPLPTGANPLTQLVSGSKTIYVSADGNYVLGGSTAAGGLDLIFGMKALASTGNTNSALSGLYFTAGVAYVNGTSQAIASYAGSANSAGNGTYLFHRRYHAPAQTFDFTGSSSYTVNGDGTGAVGFDRLAVGAGSKAWFTSGAGDLSSATYDLNVAVAAPSISGTGVFLSPVGVVNAGSLAPVGSPVAPGEYVSLFGSGLALAAAGASSFPIPTTLGQVQVTVNGTPVPLNYVSPTQINLLVPYAATGTTATFQVTNGTKSNSVDVPLAPTAPGIFSQDSSGGGLAVVLHPNFTLITPASPAALNETVQIFMTGLGAVNPTVGDGSKAPASPLSNVKATFQVLIDNQNAPIQFQGLAPGFAGLYQVNVVIPASVTKGPSVPLAISTNEAFLDQVGIPIR